MSVGYTGYATLTFDSNLYYLLLTSEGIARGRTSLATAGAARHLYDIAGSSYLYDVDRYEGPVAFELNAHTWALVKDMVLAENRAETFTLFVQPEVGESFTYNDCHWTSISFSGSEGAFVTCEIAVLSFDRDDASNANRYISPAAWGGDPSAWSANREPIPYWMTSVLSSEFADYELLSWNVNIDNALADFNVCQNVAIGEPAPAPLLERPGRAQTAFTGNFWGSGEPADAVVECEVQINNPAGGVLGYLRVYDVEVDAATKNIVGKSEPVAFERTYTSFGRYVDALDTT